MIRQVTIKDIARESGYSVATVSRTLNGNGYPVNWETRKEIEACAQRLGYTPNVYARTLKTSTSNEVAVIIPSFRNPFYTSALVGIENELSQFHYELVFYLKQHDQVDAASFISALSSKKFAGIVIANDCVSHELAAMLDELQRDIPVVVLDGELPDRRSLHGVFFDYQKGAAAAAEHLIKNGHRRVALITKVIDRPTRQSVAKGFLHAFQANGAAVGQDDIFESDISDDFDAGFALGHAVVHAQAGYTAFLANNDAVAAGALSAMIKQNIRVPEDISIMGIDDNVYARMTTPRLTSVRVPSENMGILAAKQLLETIAGKRPDSLFVEPEIVERDTVRKIN